MLLDEPFAGVDLLSIQDLKGLLLKLQARGCAVMVTDHNASQLLSVVDRAYVIANGVIVANGTPRQIVSTGEAKKLYFCEDFFCAPKRVRTCRYQDFTQIFFRKL